MSRLIRAVARAASHDDRGVTLIELMVATLLCAVVIGAALTTLDVGTKNERGQQARHDAMLEIRQAMTQLTKDLRQATAIAPTCATPAVFPCSNRFRLDMTTLREGADVAVTYTLDALGGGLYELRRKVGTGLTVPIVTHMVIDTTSNPDPPFCYSFDSAGSPAACIDLGGPPQALTAIRITLAKDPEFNPGEPITLATDVELRNL